MIPIEVADPEEVAAAQRAAGSAPLYAETEERTTAIAKPCQAPNGRGSAQSNHPQGGQNLKVAATARDRGIDPQKPEQSDPKSKVYGQGSKRAALYLRVSSDRQTVESQRHDVEQIVRARGYELVAVYEEQVSAAKRRPAFDRMRDDAHRGRFDVLVIWAIDRFGRSMAGNLGDVLALDRRGVRVVSVQESWLEVEGPARDLLIAIVSWVAEQERKRIGERTRAGLENARRKGVRLGRRRVHIDLAYASVLRAQGLAMVSIARKIGVSLASLKRALAAQKRSSEMPRLTG